MHDRPRMRPRFEVTGETTRAAWERAVRERLTVSDCVCTGKIVGRYLTLLVCERERHFWSPHLEVELEEAPPSEDRASSPRITLRGRFGPHPSVWTGFAALYAVLGFTAFAGAMYGVSQLLVGHETPWGLALVPASLALAAFVYGATFIGQGLGASQMYVLRSFVDRALEDASRVGEHASRVGGHAPGPADALEHEPASD